MIGKCKECENYGYNPNCGGYCFEFDYHPEPNSVHECCEKEGEVRGNEK